MGHFNKTLAVSPLERWKNTNLAQKYMKMKSTHWNTVYGAQFDERKPGTAHCRIEDKWLVNYGLPDVFGLGFHPQMIDNAHKALDDWGTFLASSRIYQESNLYNELEALIAISTGAEEAIAFNSVTTVHCGVLPSLTRMSKCSILIDKYAHNSLYRACEICANRGSELHPFAHNDIDEVASMLNASSGTFPIIVVDSIYSMEGDFAPLEQLHELVSAHNGILYVDDAHGTGVYGPSGGGYVSTVFETLPENVLLVGSLAKGLAGNGGFLACSKEYRQFVEFAAEGFIFNGPIPPAMLGADIAALRIVQSAEYAVMKRELEDKQNAVREIIYSVEYPIMQPESHIFAIPMGEQEAIDLSRLLFDEGIIVNLALFPAVPMKKGVIRLTPSLLHSSEDIQKLEDGLIKFKNIEQYKCS